MLRNFQLFVAAPGRQEEAETELRRWLEAVASAPQFRGGAVVREYAGEFGEVRDALAVMYDVESRDGNRAFREATKETPNPMAQDVSGGEPPDQGAILFAGGHHGHGPDADHTHGSHSDTGGVHEAEDGAGPSGLTSIEYNRGGGLLARLFHGHFEILAATGTGLATADVTASERG
jgi:hypothetical protein